jgi:cellobiose transport system substrate-binding protein
VRGHLRRTVRAAALVWVVGLAAACSKVTAGVPVADPDATPRPEVSNEPVELSISTFGEYGIDALLEEYQNQHENVTIRHDKTTDSASYFPKLQASLVAGTASDVVAIEDSAMPMLFDEPELFSDLAEVGPRDVTPDRWLDWVHEGGVTPDGTWVGYGLDIGPMAMAYRTDLFAAAGLPTEPGEVAALFESWDSYLAAGDQYVEAAGKPWFDSSAQVFTAMHNQLETGYFDDDDTLVLESNKDIKANWDKVTAAAGRGQSAKLPTFLPEWNDGLAKASFATMPAPYWMLGLIELHGGGANAGKWAVADAFPGGGANWGGSYLAVPAQSEHPEQAAALAAWLTAPEQQLKILETAGVFPSQVEALDSTQLRDTTKAYFTGGKTGQVYAELAAKVPVPRQPGALSSTVHQHAVVLALQAVDSGTPPDQGWQQAVSQAKVVAGG